MDILSTDRGREKGKFSSTFLKEYDLDFAMNVVELAPFPPFLKDTKERNIATLERVRMQYRNLCYIAVTHVCPLSVHIRGLTVPLTLSACLANFS